MEHGWIRNSAQKNTERWSAWFLAMLKVAKAAGNEVLSEVSKRMDRTRNRSLQRLARKGILAERLRRLWEKYAVGYYEGFPSCFDCNLTDCEGCNVPWDSNFTEKRRVFLRLVKPAPSAQMIPVRYYKGFGIIDGGKECLPDKRKKLAKRNKLISHRLRAKASSFPDGLQSL